MEFPREILQEAQRSIGRTGPMASVVIEEGAVKKFCEAVGDMNPLYIDPEAAQVTRWHGTIVPPTYLCTLRPESPAVDVDFGTVNLNGGNEYEWFVPVRPGDTITAQTVIEDVRGVVGRQGPMLIVTRSTVYMNHRGQTVAQGRATSIRK